MHALTRFLALIAVLLGVGLLGWTLRNYIVPLKIGIEGNYPPFTKIEADGSITGFEIDLANDFCKRMLARCELINTKFDDLLPKVKSGELDAVMASLTITDKRRKEVDFSESYYTVPSAWIAANNSFSSLMPGTLGGKKVVVLNGSPRQAWLVANYPELTVVPVAKETDIYPELMAKRADLALSSMLVAKTKFLNLPEGKGFGVVGQVVYLGGAGGVGVAVQQGNDSLRKRFNQAINASIRSGDYKQMASRYFDFDLIDRK